jgi:hypothetical protein
MSEAGKLLWKLGEREVLSPVFVVNVPSLTRNYRLAW